MIDMRQLYLFVALVIVAAILTTYQARAETGEQEYQLGAGDRVKVTVYGEADLSGTFEIGGSGVLAFPLIGEVRAGGKTVRGLEQEITRLLLDGYLKRPRVSAEVVNYRPFYILGEVKRPGSYPYVNGMTVLTAVALGGGYTYRAKKDRFVLSHGEGPDVDETLVGPDHVVLPGDVVKVRERFF